MFKERYSVEQVDIIEEAQKTFDPAYSKPLMKTLKKASGLPKWAGGGMAAAGASKIAAKRGQLATQMKEARSAGRLTPQEAGKLKMSILPDNATPAQKINHNLQIKQNKIYNREIMKEAKKAGAIGRADAAAMSQHNSPFVTMKDHSNYKSMNTDSVLGKAMTDDQIRHAVQIDGSLIRGSRLSFEERIANKIGRGVKNKAAPFVVNKSKQSYNYVKPKVKAGAVRAYNYTQPIIKNKTIQGYQATKNLYNKVSPVVGQYAQDKYVNAKQAGNRVLNSSKDMYSTLMQKLKSEYNKRKIVSK